MNTGLLLMTEFYSVGLSSSTADLRVSRTWIT